MENKDEQKSQIWKYLIEQQSTFDPNQQMQMNLQKKYQLSFNFFLSKPINEIVYELTSCSVTQAFLDSRILAQQAQFLKRQYHSVTAEGAQEIYDRIKMLGEFYNMDDKRWKSQYPMMIVTDTKSIFEKRHRRLKKIIAGQGSSDQTQQKRSFFCYSFDSQHFLKDLSNVSRIYNQQRKQQNDQSFDSEIHDVYLQERLVSKKLNYADQQMNLIEKPASIFKTQSNISHLICDFDDRITECHSSNTNVSIEKQNSNLNFHQNNRKSVKNYDSKNSNLQINLNKQANKEKQSIRKTSFLDSYLNLFGNKYRKMYLDANHSTFETTDIKTVDSQKDQNLAYDISKIDIMIQKQKQDKLKNRNKIRQKAQQLLKKVRASSYIQ